ncbi:hypothetical protein Tco_1341927, partial [Tanacetum coccineum]
SVPVSFHCHTMRAGYREVWIHADGKSLYMTVKVHIDKRVKNDKNTNVQLFGEFHRLKKILEVNVGDMMFFQLVSGNLTSDDSLCFNVSKLV